jgi:hypothetical protein
MLLGLDGGRDDGGMVGVGDQADNEVVFGNLGVESGFIRDIERDGSRTLDALAEFLRGLKGAAG